MSPGRPFRSGRTRIPLLHDRLLAVYGRQHWWPGETGLEILVGAVLTQNTAWTNVERAIANLKEAGVLDVGELCAMDAAELAQIIRPAGYFNVKAQRLLNLVAALQAAGGMDAWSRLGTEALRVELLAVKGVGPETADDILLYAFHRPVFVVDAYTRRLFGRLAWTRGDESYDELRHWVEAGSGGDLLVLQELHALIVLHAKLHCRARPRCEGCLLAADCRARNS